MGHIIWSILNWLSIKRADLHIALLPQEAWIHKLNYASFQSISEAVSLGFIRFVHH